jgi:hypothetical protein
LKTYQPTTIIAFLIAALSFTPAATAACTSDQQITEAESQEAREVVQRFTTSFLKTKDLTPIVSELYVSDFMDRYKKARSANPDLNDAPHIYFAPGLEYNSRLLKEANTEDWKRFYVAANNFILFGFISIFRKIPKDIDKLKPTDMYPASVRKLLSNNPNLANMIEKEDRANPPINSVEEMRNATAVLEQANAMMRQQLQGKPAPRFDKESSIGLMKRADFFSPLLVITDDEFFGFAKGTRLIEITTPLLFRLMLVRIDGRLKILWADPYTGD